MPKGTQKDDNTFYLAEDELPLLNQALRKGLGKRVKKEALTAYETAEQIGARMQAASYQKFPAVQKKIDHYKAEIKAGKKVDLSFEDFPEEAIDTFLFSIGASGITFYMAAFMQSPSFAENKELVEAVAALSRARHDILAKNQKVFA